MEADELETMYWIEWPSAERIIGPCVTGFRRGTNRIYRRHERNDRGTRGYFDNCRFSRPATRIWSGMVNIHYQSRRHKYQRLHEWSSGGWARWRFRIQSWAKSYKCISDFDEWWSSPIRNIDVDEMIPLKSSDVHYSRIAVRSRSDITIERAYTIKAATGLWRA